MIYFVGAGPGAPDLITLRGQRLLQRADLVIYAGSLVNPQLLKNCRPDCRVEDSAAMTLEQVIDRMAAWPPQATVVRLHTGDPSFYGAIGEQMEALDRLSLAYEVVPGVSSVSAAAAALKAEYTLPGVSQTVILARMAGRTPVPQREEIRALAVHQATMALFLSAGMLSALCDELTQGGYPADTPAALVYKASWPEEKVVRGTLATLPGLARGIERTALVLVGRFLEGSVERSRLYDPSFTHGYREGRP